jgi:hypothetical protein
MCESSVSRHRPACGDGGQPCAWQQFQVKEHLLASGTRLRMLAGVQSRHSLVKLFLGTPMCEAKVSGYIFLSGVHICLSCWPVMRYCRTFHNLFLFIEMMETASSPFFFFCKRIIKHTAPYTPSLPRLILVLATCCAPAGPLHQFGK